MFRNKYQHGLMSVLYSCGSRPLELWDMHVKSGYIRRIAADKVRSPALEIAGINFTTKLIFCQNGSMKVIGFKEVRHEVLYVRQIFHENSHSQDVYEQLKFNLYEADSFTRSCLHQNQLKEFRIWL